MLEVALIIEPNGLPFTLTGPSFLGYFLGEQRAENGKEREGKEGEMGGHTDRLAPPSPGPVFCEGGAFSAFPSWGPLAFACTDFLPRGLPGGRKGKIEACCPLTYIWGRGSQGPPSPTITPMFACPPPLKSFPYTAANAAVAAAAIAAIASRPTLGS